MGRGSARPSPISLIIHGVRTRMPILRCKHPAPKQWTTSMALGPMVREVSMIEIFRLFAGDATTARRLKITTRVHRYA